MEYGDPHRDPSQSIAQLAGVVGRQLDPAPIRPDLRHHQLPIPEELRDVYQRVRMIGAPES